jgi:hypothetical protein
VFSQLVVIGIYAALYFTAMQAQVSGESRMELVDSYLRGQFPQPGQSLAAFAVSGTLDQFAYLFYTRIAAAPMMVLFGYGIWVLARSKRVALASSLVVPLAPACLAGWWFLFPYGRSRHTVILSLFLAAGISIGVERLHRWRAGWLVALAAPAGAAALVWLAAPALIHLHDHVQRRDAMMEALTHLRRSVPKGPLLGDQKTALVLSYYLCGKRMKRPESTLTFRELDACEYRVFAEEWSNSTAAVLKKQIPEFRSRYSIPAGQPVWVVDAGFDVSVLERIRGAPEGLAVVNERQFDGAAAVFQVSLD